MSTKKSKLLLLILVTLAGLILFDHFRTRKISFEEAQQLAQHRFDVSVESTNKTTEAFQAGTVEDRGKDWHFEWRLRSGQGSVIVIVEKNGEIADSVTYPIQTN